MNRLIAYILLVLVPLAARAAAPADAQSAAARVAAEVARAGYRRADYMIPMRDGVRLHTVVYSPTDQSKSYPILLMRTAYSTDAWVMNDLSHSVGPSRSFDREKFIFVYQDLRGLYRSQGKYVLGGVYRPDKRSPRDVDESSDAYDTIDWLVRNVHHNTGKVGIWGISSEGRTTIFALLHPHPALVAASPQAAPADYYIGDDVYHNGAFRPAYNLAFMLSNGLVDRKRAALIDAKPYESDPWDYDFFLRLGSMMDLDRKYTHGAAPAWLSVIRHDTYDAFWKARNTPQYIRDVHIPVLTVGGWFDAEDFYGTLANYRAIEEHNPHDRSLLILGPWSHGGWYYLPGDRYGDISFGQKTGEFFREQVMLPFFRKALKGEGSFDMPKVLAFNTGANVWRHFSAWPPKDATSQAIYLRSNGGLAFSPPVAPDPRTSDSYVSDPAKPVPFTTEIRKGMGGRWIIEDQRLDSTRPDVLVYETPPLGHSVTIAGDIAADLFVSTSGTDSDWIVKVIDVYPDNAPDNPEEAGKNPDYEQRVRMAGYEMLLSGEIIRGKFRHGLSTPEPMRPNAVTRIRLQLPSRLHTFLPGHRIMVQIQSSWFPLYDRNPQVFTHIASAPASDFRPALERVYRSSEYPSHVAFDVIPQADLQAATFLAHTAGSVSGRERKD